MLKHIFSALCCLLIFIACSKHEPYNESADAKAEIQHAIVASQAAHQPLVIVFGANWCPTCRALAESLKSGKYAAKIASEFTVIKVDVGNFDHNVDIAQQYGNPIGGGIPGAAFLIDGKLIYATQPGELSAAVEVSEDGLYDFIKQVVAKAK